MVSKPWGMKMIDRIGKLLDEKGIDQGELESMAGLSFGRISKWKAGTGEPTAAQALRMARVLNVPLEWLVDDSAGEEIPPPMPYDRISEQRDVLKYLDDLGYEEMRRRILMTPLKTTATVRVIEDHRPRGERREQG